MKYSRDYISLSSPREKGQALTTLMQILIDRLKTQFHLNQREIAAYLEISPSSLSNLKNNHLKRRMIFCRFSGVCFVYSNLPNNDVNSNESVIKNGMNCSWFSGSYLLSWNYAIEGVENYENAKKKDNLNLSNTPDDDIERFAVYGYRTYDEDIIIEPRFKDAGEFSDGLAPVKVFSKWGYIDKKGKIAIIPKYSKAETFSEGCAVIGQIQPDIYHLYGFINTKGEAITKCIYREAFAFSEGLAAVRIDDTWGFINHKGKMGIGFQYDEVESFDDGEAIVTIDDTRLIIDKQGNG